MSGLDAHDHRNSEAVIRFHVPNLAALQGLSIAPQSATIELVSGGLWLCAAEPPARNYSAF